MIDPMTARLAQVYHNERLEAAELARQQRDRAVQAPSLLARLRAMFGKQPAAAEACAQSYITPHHTNA